MEAVDFCKQITCQVRHKIICHAYDFLCLNGILNICLLAFLYICSYDTVAIFFLYFLNDIFSQCSSRFAAVKMPRVGPRLFDGSERCEKTTGDI